MLKKHQKTFTYFRAMVSLNDSEIFLLYLDHGEDPHEFPLFLSTEPPPPYHIRVNWVRPRGGLLAMDYDEGNRIHTNNVQFVVTQLTDATIVLLRYAEDLLTRFHQGIKGEAFRSNQGGNPPHLQGPVLYDATLFKGRLQVAASDFKSHVQTFLNTVGYEIGMKHESTLVLLHDDVRSAVFSLQDEKAAATVASLKYQDLLAEPIKGRLFVCWFRKYQCLPFFVHACFMEH